MPSRERRQRALMQAQAAAAFVAVAEPAPEPAPAPSVSVLPDVTDGAWGLSGDIPAGIIMEWPPKAAPPVSNVRKSRALGTATDRRTYLRRMAGWPALRS